MDRREPVQFLSNTPVEVSFRFPAGKLIDTAFGQKTMFSTTDGRVIFAEAELASKINVCEPQPGEMLWITKRVIFEQHGRKRSKRTFWEVSTTDPSYHQGAAPDIEAAVESTGIDESDLERQLRESHDLAQHTKRNAQAREAVARQTVDLARQNVRTMPDVEPPAAAPAPEVRIRPRTQLEDALCTAIEACHRATEYARTLGYAVVFSSADIEKMAVTLLIDRQESGKQRRA